MRANRRMLLIAILLATIIAGTLLIYMKNLQKKAQEKVEIKMATVLVSSQSIPARTIVEASMITTKQIPENLVTPDMYRDIKEVIGKVTTSAVIAGEILMKQKFAEKGAEMGLSFIVPKGKRAVTVQVNQVSGIAGLLKPGDFVDVLCTFEVPRSEEEGKVKAPNYMTVTVLQNAQILALDTMMEAKPPEQPQTTQGKSQTPSPPQPSYTFVTLAVTPKDAERLSLLSERSSIRLTLRPIKEKTIVKTSGIKLSSITEEKNLKVTKKRVSPQVISWIRPIKQTSSFEVPPLPTPFTPQPISKSALSPGEKFVEVIKGTNRESVIIK
jgi:pilus assembly protein CpaB